MKVAAFGFGRGGLLLVFGLPLAVMDVSTCCAVEKLGMAPYHATVEKASAADRVQMVKILAEVASAHGMKQGNLIAGAVAFFTSPPPSALGLTIWAGEQQDDSGTVHITIGAAGLGIKLNAERAAVIAAADVELRRVFGERLKKEMPPAGSGRGRPRAS